MDTETKVGLGVGCLLLGLIIVAILVNFLLFPFFLMLVLGALGYKVSYLLCIAIWVLLSVILKKLFPKRTITVE